MFDELTQSGEVCSLLTFPQLVLHVLYQVKLCCSTRQLRDLKANFQMVSTFLAGTCPTCYWNFRKNFCDLTCSPDQASFIEADKIVEGPGFDDYEGQTV